MELRIKLVRSLNGRLKKHQATAASLGLKHIGDVTVQPDNAATKGNITPDFQFRGQQHSRGYRNGSADQRDKMLAETFGAFHFRFEIGAEIEHRIDGDVQILEFAIDSSRCQPGAECKGCRKCGFQIIRLDVEAQTRERK